MGSGSDERRSIIEQVHREEIPLRHLRVGDTFRGVGLQAYRMVGNGRLTVAEGFRAAQLVAPDAFVDAHRNVAAVSLPAGFLEECTAYNRLWRLGEAIVVAIDLTLMTATIVARTSEGFTLRVRRFPHIREELPDDSTDAAAAD